MDKHRLTPSEQLMSVSHQTISRLKTMVPELVRQRDALQKECEHWKSQAMYISDLSIPVAIENQRLTERVAELEKMLAKHAESHNMPNPPLTPNDRLFINEMLSGYDGNE